MKYLRCIYILIIALLLSSCRTQSKVVRADRSTGIVHQGPASTQTPTLSGDANNSVTKALLQEAYSWLGTPYKYGGADKSGADCSGFVMVVYQKVLDIKLPRVSNEQGTFCEEIKKKDLFPGDLVFFCTGSSKKVNHVGLYVGDGKIIHASSSKGVVISDLTQKYYIDHYDHSGRIGQYHKMIKKKGK